MSLQAINLALMAVLRDPAGRSGVAAAHDEPPEMISALPAAILLADEFEIAWDLSGGELWLHRPLLRVYVRPRTGHLEAEYPPVKAVLHSVPAAIHRAFAAYAFDGAAELVRVVGGKTGIRDYGGPKFAYHAIDFSLEAKEHVTP